MWCARPSSPMGLICNVYTGSPPHDKRCRGTLCRCLHYSGSCLSREGNSAPISGETTSISWLTALKVWPVQCNDVTNGLVTPRDMVPSLRSCIVTPLVTRWADDCDQQLPPVSNNTHADCRVWVKEQMERANKIMKREEGNSTCKKFKYWWFLC